MALLQLCRRSAITLPLLCLCAALSSADALALLCPLSAFALPVAVFVLFVLLPFYALLVINILFDVLRKVRQICTASKLLFFYRICNCLKREKEREAFVKISSVTTGNSCRSLVPVCVCVCVL